MTLDEIRKLIEALPPGPWVLDAGGMAILTPGRGDEQVRAQHAFIAAARTLLPALLKVAEKAEALFEDFQSQVHPKDETRLGEALAALEAIKLP